MAEGEGVRAGVSSGVGARRRRAGVAYSAALAQRICEAVAAGRTLYSVLAQEAGMPTAQSVGRWARERPDFAATLAEARRAGGRHARKGGGVWSYSPEVGEAVFERLSEGESLTAIARDPVMPALSTLFNWRRKIPEFEALVRLGVQARAERMCDDGWEMAMEATPETAYLTHVRLTQLRWQAGVMAPRTYRLKAQEPEAPAQVQTILFRHFKLEEDEASGKLKVVAYCPNPETGEAEREDTPGWRPPAGAVRLPGG